MSVVLRHVLLLQRDVPAAAKFYEQVTLITLYAYTT
jgi:hypothetical protein